MQREWTHFRLEEQLRQPPYEAQRQLRAVRQQLESELREARNEAAVAAAAVTREHNAELDALLKEFAESCMAGKVRIGSVYE